MDADRMHGRAEVRLVVTRGGRQLGEDVLAVRGARIGDGQRERRQR